MPTTTYKIVFLHQWGDSQRAISQQLGVSHHGVQCALKKLEVTEQVSDKIRCSRPNDIYHRWTVSDLGSLIRKGLCGTVVVACWVISLGFKSLSGSWEIYNTGYLQPSVTETVSGVEQNFSQCCWESWQIYGIMKIERCHQIFDPPRYNWKMSDWQQLF